MLDQMILSSMYTCSSGTHAPVLCVFPCGRLPGGRGHSNDFEDRGASAMSVAMTCRKIGSSKGELDLRFSRLCRSYETLLAV